jgi:alkanesulfonate monooxygenase SsuD/methylene tetrahydromethanopterin reductase-like flavin-dependent oxidoreductase (luciferase family)
MFYTWIDANVDRARAQVEHYVDPYYAGRFNVASAVYGSAAACAERLQGYVDAGAETLLLAVAGLDPHQLETISRELVPLLR